VEFISRSYLIQFFKKKNQKNILFSKKKKKKRKKIWEQRGWSKQPPMVVWGWLSATPWAPSHPHGAKGVAETTPNGGLAMVLATPLGTKGWPKPLSFFFSFFLNKNFN
jgi:hypothetical protein